MRRGKYGIVVLVLAGLGLSACGTAGTPVKAANSSTIKTTGNNPYSGWEVHGEAGLFTVKLPPGWTKTVDDKVEGWRVLKYADTTGNFFGVWISPPPTGYDADRTWQLNWADDARRSFRVVDEGPSCAPSPLCMTGDGVTEIHAMLSIGVPRGTGPEFQFDFGSKSAETIENDGMFRLILTSFRTA